MNKTLKLILAAVITISAGSAMAQPKNVDNWVNSTGTPWRNGDGTLCWRDATWTPATAAPNCDGWLAPKPAAAPAAAASKVTQKKITLQADTLFDFDKSNLKSEGVATLNKLAQDIKKMKLEVVIIVGYTDGIGTDAYNIALGQRRANAVKAFLTNDGGVEATRVYTESKGKADPVASNATAEGRAKNRRAVIEVVGTQAVK
ncbi:MAG: OmpA family protein [Burkholderiaceae bacterium]|nr:OmpA family protein [Burkholderiaceae bacterium]NDC49850.1 OmpA family protein [Burkholderiaceae bacterium]